MAPAPARTSRRSWLLCILLLAATTLNYLDRQTMSILAPAIQKEMGLDNVALGWFFAAFYYTYTLAQFAVGAFLDRSHLRWAFVIAVVAWSVAGGLTALATGFGTLLLCRLLLGLAESANWPAAMRIVARALPPKDRPLGNGIFTSGTSIGALIAPSLILGIAAYAGWRWAFVAVGALGLLWGAVWLRFTRHGEFDSIWRPPEPGNRSTASAYGRILSDRRFWRVFAVTILVNPCLYFNVNWLPAYFSQNRGLQPGRDLGVALTLIYLGLDLGYLACGFGVRHLARRHAVAKARRAVFTTATVLLCTAAAVPLIPGTKAAVGALVIVNFAVGMWIAMYLTMAQEVSAENVSTAAGLLGGSGSLAGAVLMWGVGEVTQRTGSFAIPFIGMALAAILAAAAGYSVTRETRKS